MTFIRRHSTPPPHDIMGCRGGSVYVKGVLGFWGFGFLVSKILGFLVSKILGVLVSTFQSFKDSTIPYYQISISCFLVDIDRTSKTLKILLDGSLGLFGARLFQHVQCRFPKF